VFSISSHAQIVISEIDFPKADSIAKIIRGLNQIRGTQSVVLKLNEKQSIKFVDAAHFSHLEPLSVHIKSNGNIYFNRSEKMKNQEEFIRRLKELSTLSKSIQKNKFPVMLTFHDNISGADGQQILRSLSSNDFEIIMQREETIKERNHRIKQASKELKRKL